LLISFFTVKIINLVLLGCLRRWRTFVKCEAVVLIKLTTLVQDLKPDFRAASRNTWYDTMCSLGDKSEHSDSASSSSRRLCSFLGFVRFLKS